MTTPPKIAVIDYSLGNLHSVERAIRKVGATSIITSDITEVEAADGIVLPGVGAFGDAMQHLSKHGLEAKLKNVVQSGKPLFGICLGFQLLFESSSEFGCHRGLGLVPGTVERLPTKTPSGDLLKIPHIGWNNLEFPDNAAKLKSPLSQLSNTDLLYFVHSFIAIPAQSECILATTTYGDTTFCSSVLTRNIFACQFHPEKSGQTGLDIYANWVAKIKKGN